MSWLLRQVTTQPDEVALRIDAASFTWRQVATRAEEFAAGLQAEVGGPVALLCRNSLDFVAVVWASLWTGTSLVLLNARLSDDELSWQIRDSGVSLLIADRSCSVRSLDLDAVRQIQLESLPGKPSSAVPVALGASSTMLYTSGSTSKPKLVSLSWQNHEASALASAKNLGIESDDDWLCCLPLYHVGGLSIVLRGAIYGTRVTLLGRFDAAQVMAGLQAGCTLVSLVPTMLIRLAREAGSVQKLAAALKHTALRAILLGGGPADPDFIGECLKAGLPVVQTYGMTEACSQLATMPPARALEKLGSSGLPLDGVELSIRNPTGEPSHGAGVIWVRGPMVISSYAGRTSDDDERFVDGWFRTGDIGELDEDGFLWVHGRHDHVIVTGGENVAPEMVERVIGRHPRVEEVMVFGEDDVEWGRRVVAVVVSSATPEELDAYCDEHLAGHQRPKAWQFLAQLPRTSTGKLLRGAAHVSITE